MAGLSGMKEITAYTNRSETTILKLIREEDFPAVKLCGKEWESDTDEIDAWRLNKIRKRKNGKKQ